ncbi:hypothetical protein PR048_021939 [Dryococelus australis]|uniref:Uncharacterized protein n=1 Tax=Dryococelus australis TaxID=614101 RepID=A0ABQ9GZL3_9NEOP|nr:hypothetical protein PR048_021939 [Dryococelus australis]
MGVIEVSKEQRRNVRAGKTGVPRENPLTNGMRKSGDPGRSLCERPRRGESCPLFPLPSYISLEGVGRGLKGDTGTHIKCRIATMREALN